MNTTIRRILATSAAAGVASIATAVPAVAEPDEGWPGSNGESSSTTEGGTRTVIREVLVDDGALEFLQIGLGALAGVAVAGAAAVTVRRLGHAPHPA